MERTQRGIARSTVTDLPALVRTSSKPICVLRAPVTATNQTLEKAGRVDDFFQLGMAMCQDALTREESCGAHFRSEYQTDQRAKRNVTTRSICHVAAFEWTGDPMNPKRTR
jgi:succinate dehydrogenase / fumarate reductase, flavoprotein subunit